MIEPLRYPLPSGGNKESWTCSQCGQTHSGVPEGWGFDTPWPWCVTDNTSRAKNSALKKDSCVLPGEDFFVQGCLEIPILDFDKPLIWGVWVSLSETNFERHKPLFEDSRRIDEPPYFGWLSSRIQIYPDTLLLKTHVHTRNAGIKPFMELERTDHPLAVEQRLRITQDRKREIAELMEHRWLHPKWDSK